MDFPPTLTTDTKVTEKPKNNALNSGENQNENNNEINGKNQFNDFGINSLKTVKEPTVINTMNQPDTNQNNKEEPKIDNYKESAVTNPFFTQDKNPFDKTLGESNILPQIKNPNPNQLESSQQQNNDLNDNVDPFSNVEEVSTIIPKKEQNILNNSEINNDPFAGNTKIDTIIQSDINLNNNEQKNDNKNTSPSVSNNPLYIEAHNNQNQNLLNNIQTDSNISSQDNNNDNNIINNVENQFKNISIGNNQDVFGETTESIINDSQKLNENNNNINQNQSNNNMAYDEEEEKIDFASKIESFNTNQNQQHISVPSFTDIISKEKMNNDNNNNNQNA